ncbi:MAG: Dna2/Cas4 domain-containing protein [Thermoplasmataceae archaeon]
MIEPSDFRGTDVNYFFICKRRAWLSIHEMTVTDGTQFVKHGLFLSNRKRSYGHSEMSIGRNKIDNLKVDGNGNYVVHEFKRGSKLLEADIMQVSHYINVIEHSGSKVGHGEVHLLKSKRVELINLDEELKRKLLEAYAELQNMKYSIMPKAELNYFCHHGCSFVEFCWS